MKKIVLTSLMMVCLPFLAVAQSVEDDLYFIPKKKAEKKEEVKQEVKVAVPQKQNNTTVYAAPGSTVVVKDVKGNMRDVDEYNRRYTSRDNTFSMENDTLYIEEKPLNERGEWVNGFEGSQDDYEYAMRIVRFRNPRYAIPVSSPLYWDVVYGDFEEQVIPVEMENALANAYGQMVSATAITATAICIARFLPRVQQVHQPNPYLNPST